MNAHGRLLGFYVLLSTAIYAEVVTTSLQVQLENLQNREIVLEKNLMLIQSRELLTLESALQSAIQDFLKREAQSLLDNNPAFQPAVHQYAQLLVAMGKELTPLYYDALFWVRYVPAYLYQEDVAELQKETLTFPLTPRDLATLKDFSQAYYAYKTFFEQWPVDKQEAPAKFYAKAQEAYKRFALTQTFVTSLLAKQQDMQETEKQMHLLISKFKTLLPELTTPTLSDKTQYEHLVSVYALQRGDTGSQDYKQYQVWSLIASLLYYRHRAGIAVPDDATQAQLFHKTYTELSDFIKTFDRTWHYYKEAQTVLGALSAYDKECVLLLEPKPVVKPQPEAVKPVPHPTKVDPVLPKQNSVTPTKTISEDLDDYIGKYFSDAALLVAADLTKVLARYTNLLAEYKNSKEYRDTDYMGYVVWADFVPVRVAELQVISLKRTMPFAQRKATVFAYNQALNAFRKTPAWAYVRHTYPSLFKELTEVCSQYANWLGQQR